MPNIKSAIKRVKVTKVKTLRNRMVKSGVRNIIKKFDAAIAAGDLDSAKALYPSVVKKIDMAASKGVLHKNAANRKKARLALRLRAVEKAN